MANKSKKNEKQVPKVFKSYVKKAIKVDKEQKSITMAALNTSATDAGWQMSYPSQGDTIANRDGDVIYLDSIRVKYTVTAANVSPLTARPINYRVLVYSTQVYSSITSAFNFMRGASPNYGTAICDDSKVKVLYDRTHSVFDYNTGSLSADKVISLHGKKIQFQQGTNATPDGYIYMHVIPYDSTGLPIPAVSSITGTMLLKYKE